MGMKIFAYIILVLIATVGWWFPLPELKEYRSVPKRSNGTVSKTVGSAFPGSNPGRPAINKLERL